MSIRGDEHKTQMEYHILTLGTNSWRNIDSIPVELTYRCAFDAFDKSYCIAGVIYSFDYIAGCKGYAIVAFEVGPEKFRILHLPQGMIANNSCQSLIEVGERLGLIDYELKTICILEDYENNLWNRRSFFPANHKKPFTDGEAEPFEPIGAIHTGEILLKSQISNKLFFDWAYYDMESKRSRMVYALSNIPGDADGDTIYNKHVESLFGLKKT
ncbi:uncharacterized protein LOC132304697 [Cornus florida]|uniref:uncharacterized protein LOC132304697 n=1 Tax=Cornus florida TaxID=4283 RepID=UPI00289A61C3|nr:uncharacterized protein LOC132304697 [Cornus florida]